MALLDFLFGQTPETLQGYQLDPVQQELARRRAALQFGSGLLGLNASMDPGGAIGRGLQGASQTIQQGQQRGIELARRSQLDEQRRKELEDQRKYRNEQLEMAKKRSAREEERFGWERIRQQNRELAGKNALETINSGIERHSESGWANEGIGQKVITAETLAKNPETAAQGLQLYTQAVIENDKLVAAKELLSTMNLPANVRPLLESGELTLKDAASLIMQNEQLIIARDRFTTQRQDALAGLIMESHAKYEQVGGEMYPPGHEQAGQIIPGTGKWVKTWGGVDMAAAYEDAYKRAGEVVSGKSPMQEAFVAPPGGEASTGNTAQANGISKAKDALTASNGEPLKALYIVRDTMPRNTPEDIEAYEAAKNAIKKYAGHGSSRAGQGSSVNLELGGGPYGTLTVPVPTPGGPWGGSLLSIADKLPLSYDPMTGLPRLGTAKKGK